MSRQSGLVQVFAGAVLISFAAVFVKLVHVGPVAAGFYRMTVGATGLAVLVAWQRLPLRVGRRAMGYAVAGGFLFAADLLFWHQSIFDVGPGLSTILANFQVFLLAAYGMVVLKERMGWRLAVAVPLALVGLFLLVGADWGNLPGDYRRGVLLGLGTAVAYGSYLLVLRASQARAERLNPVVNLMIICVVAAAVLAVWAAAAHQSLVIPDAGSLGLLVAYGITAQVLGWLLISHGLPRTPASRAGLVLLCQPGLTFVWDVLFFARPTGARDVIGVVLALGAIYMGTRR